MDKSMILAAIKKQLESTAELHQQNLDEIKQSISGETKRTAGDKHETALAMLQSEQERIGRHLKQVKEQLSALLQLMTSNSTRPDGSGSLVTTDKGIFFIAIAAGKIEINRETIFAVSPAAPITSYLLHTNVSESFILQRQTYTILKKQ